MQAQKIRISNGVKIIIADSFKSMSEAAARLVIKLIKKDGGAVLGLPSGGTPIGLYNELVKAAHLKAVSFKQVKAFTLDEYAGLAETAPPSFCYFMNERLFKRLDIKNENIFFLNGQAEDMAGEGARYEALIKKHGGIDLLILGIGLNGHIGFNEPGSAFNSQTRAVKLTEKTRRANAGHFNSLREVPRQAITMGLATIMKSKKIILLASGDKKAGIIKRALRGKITRSVPASILQKHKNLTVILDMTAAKDLMNGNQCR